MNELYKEGTRRNQRIQPKRNQNGTISQQHYPRVTLPFSFTSTPHAPKNSKDGGSPRPDPPPPFPSSCFSPIHASRRSLFHPSAFPPQSTSPSFNHQRASSTKAPFYSSHSPSSNSSFNRISYRSLSTLLTSIKQISPSGTRTPLTVGLVGPD